MLAKELRQKGLSELEDFLMQLRNKQQHIRFQVTSGKAKNVKEYQTLKRDIARIQTLLHEMKK